MDIGQHEVIISGAGPVGLLMANLLGQHGIHTLLVERRTEMFSYARAVGIDDEALRALQAADLLKTLSPYLQFNPGIAYLSQNGYRFFSPDAALRPYGYPILSTFFQPQLEQILRDGLLRYPCIKFMEGCELQNFEQQADGVNVELKTGNQPFQARGTYLLACDGGRSPIRKQLGLSLSGDSQSKTWLVTDVRDSAHLSEQIIGAHAEKSDRPMVTISLPGDLRRFECMLYPHEAELAEPSSEVISEWFSPFTGGMQLEVIRKKNYERYYRYAGQLQHNRVFLLGDAAHLVPPYGGQGLCSGKRDALNLSWKLIAVLRYKASDKILKTYQQERKHQMKAMVSFIKTIARQVENSARRVAVRSAVIQTAKYRSAKPEPFCKNGFVLKKSTNAGKMILQPEVMLADGTKCLLDERCGYRFLIIGWRVDVTRSLSQAHQEFWQSLGAKFISIWSLDDPLSRGCKAESLFSDDEIWDTYFSGKENVMILRPDKFIVSQCPVAELNQTTGKFRKLMF